MLRVVIPIFRSRVSPIFDACVRALLLDIDHGRVIEKKEIYLDKLTLSERFKLLRQADVRVVVCGYISDIFCDILSKENIKVINGIAGGVDEVVAAFIDGCLDDQVFHMPGSYLNSSPKKGNRKRKNSADVRSRFESEK